MASIKHLIANFDLTGVQRAIEDDPDKLDAPCYAHMTPLMYATKHSKTAIAQWLVENGAKLDVQSSDSGQSALMLACWHNQPDTAELLVDHGANVNLQNHAGNTALMLACWNPDAASRLRCIQLCWASGASLKLKNKHGRDAMAYAHYAERGDVVTFLEFLTASDISQILLVEARLPRSVLLNFYEENLCTMASCAALDIHRLVQLGVGSPDKQLIVLRRLNPYAQMPRQSLQRRASQAASELRRRMSGALTYDAFLTHDWGQDGLNHDIVTSVNTKLRQAGKVTWFDEDRLTGNIAQQISHGIKASRKVVIFVTKRYMEKLDSPDEDYCKDEFLTAARVRKTRNMIPAIIEPAMLDTALWNGPLQLKLGGHLYIDLTTPSRREENFPQLLAALET